MRRKCRNSLSVPGSREQAARKEEGIRIYIGNAILFLKRSPAFFAAKVPLGTLLVQIMRNI